VLIIFRGLSRLLDLLAFSLGRIHLNSCLSSIRMITGTLKDCLNTLLLLSLTLSSCLATYICHTLPEFPMKTHLSVLISLRQFSAVYSFPCDTTSLGDNAGSKKTRRGCIHRNRMHSLFIMPQPEFICSPPSFEAFACAHPYSGYCYFVLSKSTSPSSSENLEI